MDLRYYQSDAVRAVLNALSNKRGINPCIEIPTGGGKTPIIATLCKTFCDNGYRTLVVAHRKELLEQTVDKLKLWAPNAKWSIVSAGLGSKDYDGDVVVAGVQSVYRSYHKLLERGKIDFLIVDEAHLIPAEDENEGGMYQTLVNGLRANNPALNVIGLTATPYRLSSGSVCGEGKILSEITYSVGVRELINGGYLSKLTTKAPPITLERDTYHIKHGEFDAREVDETFNVEGVVFDACQSIAKICAHRHSVLIFCCSIEHCNNVAKALSKITGEEVGVVTGSTKSDKRESLLRRFKGDLVSDLLGESEKPLKYLCNVDVLTTGFDATNVDAVVLLRPTASTGLYYQMCGRGFRVDTTKQDCLILDYAGNIKRFGALDQLQPPTDKHIKKEDKEPKSKTCPICFECVDINARTCPNCGCKLKCDDFLCPSCSEPNDKDNRFCTKCGFQLRYDSRDPKHDSTPDDSEIISNGSLPVIEEDVVLTSFDVFTSKKSGKEMLRATYTTPSTSLCEFACFDHTNYARVKAIEWFRERVNLQMSPVSSKQALDIIEFFEAGRALKVKYVPRRSKYEYNKLLDVKLAGKVTPIGPYPRIDNPLSFDCEECGCESFRYVKQMDSYYVICAKCGATVAELSLRTVDGKEELRSELADVRRKGIAFYDPFAPFRESDSLDDNIDASFESTLDAEQLDDIPF